MTNKKFTAAQTAHKWAYLSWNPDELEYLDNKIAEELIENTPYEKLNSRTWAETSIEQAIKSISDKILNGEELNAQTDFSKYKMQPTPEIYDKIVEILDDIHNKWVLDNAKKYQRNTPEESERKLFQHLPTALIGLEEVALDLMFLAPFLKEMGIETGEMSETMKGKYTPNKEIIQAYERFVERYKANNNINSEQSLKTHIKDCIEGEYDQLEPNSKQAIDRLRYMHDRIDLLTDTVKSKNPKSFNYESDLSNI